MVRTRRRPSGTPPGDGEAADPAPVVRSSAARRRRRGSRGGRGRRRPGTAAAGDNGDEGVEDVDADEPEEEGEAGGPVDAGGLGGADDVELPDRPIEGRILDPKVAEEALVRKPQIGDTRPAPPSPSRQVRSTPPRSTSGNGAGVSSGS